MFTHLKLTNFKAWKDTEDLDLSPITVLLGTNSSGKSSLIQSLLLLKQTVQSPDRTIHLNLGGDEINDLFDFGDFDDVLKRGTSSPRQFLLKFSFKAGKQSRIHSGTFSCIYGRISSGGVAVQTLELTTGEHSFRAIRRERGAYSIFLDDETQPRGKGRDLAPERSISFPAEAITLFGADGALLEDLSLAIRRELENIVYLGPLRRKPERDYVWNKTNPGGIASDGYKAIDVLLSSALIKGDGNKRIIKSVSKWLNRMRLADGLEVHQLGRSTRYEVVVARAGSICNIRDVGIGISQVLPVLTVAYFAPEGSTIVLEEPEIHLHPLAQSVLAELFVEVSAERNVQFIVETHSEHLFRRMQTLMAKQQIKRDQVAMYFIEPGDAGASVRTLELDEYGRVKNWPEDFFGDTLGETREQARLMFERQQGEKL